MTYKKKTQAIRNQMKRSEQREHSAPIYLTSSYVFDSAEHGQALFAGEMQGNNYGRYHNPNAQEFAQKMADLEEAEAGLSFTTGMAALFTAIMAHSNSGDKVVASRCLFGSTVQILTRLLPRWGIKAQLVDNNASMDEWDRALSDDASLCLIETPANPTLDLIDIAALAQLCKEKSAARRKKGRIIFLVDNAYSTPFLQTPILLGADLVMHSATKYIDGQGRVLGGVVVGSTELMEPLVFMLRHTGPTMSPFNAWLLSKSLEHLGIRMEKHSDNALGLAEYLQAHKRVAQVNYPFIESHPRYELATKQMEQGGGTLSFYLHSGKNAEDDRKRAMNLLNHLNLCSLSANLGDTRTIVTHPTTTTHSSLTEEERVSMSIYPGLIRVSVGLEDPEDIVADFAQALESC